MHRPERIAETLREEIAQIVGYELEDPRLTLVTVTEVRVADDLRDASVYVTVSGDEKEHQTALRAGQFDLALVLPNSPRTSSGASGLGSNVSCCAGPPDWKMKTTDFARGRSGGWAGGISASARNRSSKQ